jgi:hypothetical protein
VRAGSTAAAKAPAARLAADDPCGARGAGVVGDELHGDEMGDGGGCEHGGVGSLVGLTLQEPNYG